MYAEWFRTCFWKHYFISFTVPGTSEGGGVFAEHPQKLAEIISKNTIKIFICQIC